MELQYATKEDVVTHLNLDFLYDVIFLSKSMTENIKMIDTISNLTPNDDRFFSSEINHGWLHSLYSCKTVSGDFDSVVTHSMPACV